MKLSDEEFALILSLARRKAYEQFLAGDEGSFDTWMWLKALTNDHIKEVEENGKKLDTKSS